MTKLTRIAVWILILILAGLIAAYVYGMVTQLDEMTERPVRISYFLADVTVLFPLALVAIIGLFKGRAWGRQFFLLTLGALLFDTAHQVYYLFWDNYFGVATIASVSLLVVIVGYVAFAFYAICLRAEDST